MDKPGQRGRSAVSDQSILSNVLNAVPAAHKGPPNRFAQKAASLAVTSLSTRAALSGRHLEAFLAALLSTCCARLRRPIL
jgi:hypothetical protein